VAVAVTDPPPARVRRARLGDVPAMTEQYAAVAAEGRWIGAEVVDPADRSDRLRASVAGADEGVFVAEVDGGLVGQISVSLRPYGVCELGMLVAAGWRGRGVGTALVRTGLDWAREAGAHKVALQVWPHNEAAIGLYRKFGFVEEGRLRRHYRRRNGELWDAVVMGLLLDEA
jgi:RimJ/RimL family protein N-acetyltransferase